MINMRLAQERGLSKRDISQLRTLHRVMTTMASASNQRHTWYTSTKKEKKQLRKDIRNVEYLMQRLWGFEADKSKHYHHLRFDCLRKPIITIGGTHVKTPNESV